VPLTRTPPPLRKRLEILVEKGTEELLPEELYAALATDYGSKIMGQRRSSNVIPRTPTVHRTLRRGRSSQEGTSGRGRGATGLRSPHAEVFRPIRVEGLNIIPLGQKKYQSSFVIIEPGMAFGTGRHESTGLMIRLMKTRIL